MPSHRQDSIYHSNVTVAPNYLYKIQWVYHTTNICSITDNILGGTKIFEHVDSQAYKNVYQHTGNKQSTLIIISKNCTF